MNATTSKLIMKRLPHCMLNLNLISLHFNQQRWIDSQKNKILYKEKTT